ncbi:hypothetical protein KQ944_07550 [Bacillus subtilis]|uniref:DUF7674 family protein n=1 Tax=Pseudochrobactrum asaccharolyticum TaxID=354351 RepID=UPI001F44BA1E|nr:hypothetical protein [Pseudochrobactrum asaccharolyticum]MCF7645090.1 hypothetical protein [Pseudochrobactrum asaccharolyticum]MCF7671479.1 hypothetical protein [Bacillus subtilis]
MLDGNDNAILFKIERSKMFEPLLEADPSFLRVWQAFEEEYQSEDDLPLYLALSEFAGHLIQKLETDNTHQFDAVFDVVERWHINGDSYVQEAATIGLLEDLQNHKLHRSTRPEDFVVWLRPETLKWWIKVYEFWTLGKPIV